MTTHNITKGANIDCPLCDKPMRSLWGETTEKEKGFHHWCDNCEHGWYISDLMNIARQNLEYTASQGKSGKSPQEIRRLILAKDKDEQRSS